MANTDIRLLLSYRGHPKIKKLRLRLGGDGIQAHIWLLMFASEARPDGVLAGMDWDDIELAADWRGEQKLLVRTLLDLKLLDLEDGTYSVHDWANNNPWAAGAPGRSEKARKAAMARHGGGTNNQGLTPKKDAPSKTEQCNGQEVAMQGAGSSNAPSPSPSPSPSPKPTPKPLGRSADAAGPVGEAFDRMMAKYPKRAGDNPRKPALKALNATVKRGAKLEEVEAGLDRYIPFCEATGKIGTETVMQAATFFGPNERWKGAFTLPRQGAAITTANDDAIARAMGLK